MAEPEKTPNPFDLLIDQIRAAIRDEIRVLLNTNPKELLAPEELARRLNLPVSWVYEQSRHGKIPTHRIGRYIRFDLLEVIESQKKQP
jgi:excisionase family DNA binding protein